MLVDVTPLGLTGRDAEAALEEAGVTTNKNAIPFDKNPPAVCSGIRLGTPALTTRGVVERWRDEAHRRVDRSGPRSGQ